MTRFLFPVFIGLTLVACGSNTPEQDAPAAAPAEEAALTEGNNFPDAIQGDWAIDEKNCRPGSGERELQMTIAGDEVRQYESVGKVREIDVKSAERAVAKIDFQGEGYTWDREMEFIVEDGGKGLTRVDKDPFVTYRYMRCE